MAVSLSAGGSGYMLSDYMISDAAIPQRVEESIEQADKSGQFSKVLSGLGKPDKTAADNSGAVREDNAAGGISQELQKAAEAVASGELKPEDIPEELLTSEALGELEKLVEALVPEDSDEQDISKNTAAQELAAMLAAQQAVVPDDRSEELSALTVAKPEVTEVQPVMTEPVQEVTQPQDIVVVQPETEIPAETAEPVIVAEAVQQAESVQTAEKVPQEATVQKMPGETQEKSAAGQQESGIQTDSGEAVQQADQSGNSAHQESSSENSGQPEAGASQKAVQQSKPLDSRIREDISRAEVKATEAAQKEQSAPETEQKTAAFEGHTAQRSRVVSKSDELQMIKGAADTKTTDGSEAQSMAQPQGVITEKPLIFTRQDGEQVTVKPSEVAQQVADRLIERTEDLAEGETEYSVTLNPEDLGRITVKMTKTADGAVSVSIAAENSRTLRIIEDNGTAIQDSLKQNGVQLESWQTVSESRQEAHAEDYQGSSKNPYRENENHQQEQDSGDESFAEIIASM